MIDVHSHILPGIDDGAQTLSESLILAQFAVENGITHSVMTPHIHPGRYENDIKSISRAFETLQIALSEQQIPLEIAFAAEVRISAEMMPMIASDNIPFLGSYKDNTLLLLEMPHSHILPGSEKLIDWLMQRNIRPIIAHPERNKQLMADYSRVIPLLQQGCLLQLTAASIAGKFGRECLDFSRYLVENDWVSYVASDAHNIQHRPPDMQQCVNNLTLWAGQEKTNLLVRDNAWKIVSSHFN